MKGSQPLKENAEILNYIDNQDQLAFSLPGLKIKDLGEDELGGKNNFSLKNSVTLS